jgi:hypothetical protein
VVTLRATQKVLKRLPPVSADDDLPDTALGDWYVNRLVVDRQPLLLLVSSRSLLAIIEPARNLRELPERLPNLVAQRLKRLGVEGALIEREAMAMHPVRVGPTRDRSVLGTLVDFARTIPVFLPVNDWQLDDLRLVESRLAETPCRVPGSRRGVIFPQDDTPRMMEETWGRSPRAIH